MRAKPSELYFRPLLTVGDTRVFFQCEACSGSLEESSGTFSEPWRTATLQA
jgi:hypothetical protein